MKVNVTLTVELDSAVWAAEYGLDPQNVRADVKSLTASSVYGQLVEVLGIATNVYETGTR